jgi:hypothetical protein
MKHKAEQKKKSNTPKHLYNMVCQLFHNIVDFMKAYFEVMMDSQEVAKTVLRSPGILHSVS